MARPSSNYKPGEYGRGFQIIPEGPHQVRILTCSSEYGKKGEYWVAECESTNERYQSKYPLKMFLFLNGVVEALHDAAGRDPSAVADRDYQPTDFLDWCIWVYIVHKPGKKGGTFANIDRPYPAFTKGIPGNRPTAQEEPQHDDGGFGDDEIPF